MRFEARQLLRFRKSEVQGVERGVAYKKMCKPSQKHNVQIHEIFISFQRVHHRTGDVFSRLRTAGKCALVPHVVKLTVTHTPGVQLRLTPVTT